MEIVNKLELENERLELRNSSAKSLVTHYLADSKISGDTRERLLNILSLLETGDSRKQQQQVTFMRSPAGGLDTISEVGSTGMNNSLLFSLDFCAKTAMNSARLFVCRFKHDPVGRRLGCFRCPISSAKRKATVIGKSNCSGEES